MRTILVVMALLFAACGGSSLSPDCDPCPFDHATINGQNVNCSCATGSGSQTYQRVMETTTLCDEARAAWKTYALATCHG